MQVCYGIPRRQILHCEDRYVSLYMSVDYFEDQRREMVTAIRAIADHVAAQISKSALDKRVLEAMAKVPRHEFVPVEVQLYAYLNRPLPIGFDKTISQPLMVAVMTDLLELKPSDVILEIRAIQRLKRQTARAFSGQVGRKPSQVFELPPFYAAFHPAENKGPKKSEFCDDSQHLPFFYYGERIEIVFLE